MTERGREAESVSASCEIRDKGSLPDPSIAGDENDLRLAPQGFAQSLAQQRRLLFTPEKRARDI
jgi:hypothetical protein